LPARQFTAPYIIRGGLESRKATRLDKVLLTDSGRGDDAARYSEDWVQNLIFQHPDLLPVSELEPAFAPLYPVCRELLTPAGPIDNLFVSRSGGLVLVECKLWRNPEARREVIGQALDYAKEIARWSYEDLVNAVKKTTKSNDDEVLKAIPEDEIDQAEFIDAVSRHLKLGRFLLLIVGDGIREGVEDITKFVQSHAGLHFTFGLVELSVFRIPSTEEFVVQPRILANSYMIERGVVRIDQKGNIYVEQPATSAPSISPGQSTKRTTISEDDFYEQLSASTSPQVSESLSDYMERLAEIGVTPVYGSSSLNLRWFPESTRKMNFGSVRKNGTVDTDPANWVPNQIGKPEIGEKYQEAVAALVQGKAIKVKNGSGHSMRVVRSDNSALLIGDLLARKEDWFRLIVQTQEELATAVRAFDSEQP
jgi:hypothetical protein